MILPDAFLTAPIAHRGLHTGTFTRPENSLAAFEAAIMFGFGIELDVQLTADNQAIVFHDYDTQRLLRLTGAVQQLTFRKMQSAGILGSTEKPPLLTEVLAMVAGQVPLMIELKDQSGTHTGTDGRLERQVADALAAYQGHAAVMSFNPDQMIEMRRVAPDLPRGVVTESFAGDDWGMVPAGRLAHLASGAFIEETGACFISHARNDLNSDLVAAWKAKDMRIITWTVRSEGEERAAREVADNITFEDYLPSS